MASKAGHFYGRKRRIALFLNKFGKPGEIKKADFL